MHTFKITNSFRALFFAMHFFCTFWHPLSPLCNTKCTVLHTKWNFVRFDKKSWNREKKTNHLNFEDHNEQFIKIAFDFPETRWYLHGMFIKKESVLLDKKSWETCHCAVVWMHCRKQPRQLFADEINALQNSRIIQPFTPRLLFKVCAFWLKVK